MLEQALRAATMVSRQGEAWVERVVAGDAVLALPEIGVEAPPAAIHAGIAWVGGDPAATLAP